MESLTFKCQMLQILRYRSTDLVNLIIFFYTIYKIKQNPMDHTVYNQLAYHDILHHC